MRITLASIANKEYIIYTSALPPIIFACQWYRRLGHRPTS